MTLGRRTCDILKGIRNKISGNNDEADINECTFQGECSGTCPKCEAELKEINSKLSHDELVAKIDSMADKARADKMNKSKEREEESESEAQDNSSDNKVINNDWMGDMIKFDDPRNPDKKQTYDNTNTSSYNSDDISFDTFGSSDDSDPFAKLDDFDFDFEIEGDIWDPDDIIQAPEMWSTRFGDVSDNFDHTTVKSEQTNSDSTDTDAKK